MSLSGDNLHLRRGRLHSDQVLEAGVADQSPDQLLVFETSSYKLLLADVSVIVDVQETEDSLGPVYRQLLADPLIEIQGPENLHHFTQLDALRSILEEYLIKYAFSNAYIPCHKAETPI